MSYVQVGKSFEELELLTQGQAKSQVLADLYWEKGAKAYNEKDYEAGLVYFEKILIDFPASSLAAGFDLVMGFYCCKGFHHFAKGFPFA